MDKERRKNYYVGTEYGYYEAEDQVLFCRECGMEPGNKRFLSSVVYLSSYNDYDDIASAIESHEESYHA